MTYRQHIPYFDNVAKIYPDGPFGLYVIKLERGMTPKEFQGYFTSFTQAERIVNEHIQNKKKD